MTALALALAAAGACAQAYPSRPVRLVVASAAGGGTDITARNVAKALGDQLRHAVFVENRPGAGSVTGTEHVARATPDGHTLLVSSGSSMVMNGLLYRNVPYDPLRDFVAVGFVAAYPFLLVVRPDFPGGTLAEFVRHAKERPGRLSYASAGVGTLQHVWGTILFRSLGLDLLHVPYKGAAGGHQDVIAGRVDAMFDNLSASRKYVEAGRMKALAVSSTARAAQLPDVPTVNETGVGRFDGESWMGVFAPTGTPSPVVDSLRTLLAGVVRDAEFAARVERDGGRTMAVAPQQQQPFLRQEVERWGRLVREHGVSAE